MRSGAWLGVVGIYLIAGCNTTYTAPPTECDDWCTTTHGRICPYDPAACVQQCEIEKSQAKVDCSAYRTAEMSCAQEHPDVELSCTYDSPCDEERSVLTACSAGIPRDTAVCDRVCGALVYTACPHPDHQGCVARCLAEGQAASECRTERDALTQCANDNPDFCDGQPTDSMPAPPFDPEALPSCKPERDALKSCGLASSSAGAAGATATP